jgi:ERAP1-like C-terminal domain
VNVDRIGFYRVHYDEANWMLIANELVRKDSGTNISPISRAMLINDAAIFFASGTLKVRIFLELLRHLEHDVSIVRKRELKGKKKFYGPDGNSYAIECNIYSFSLSLSVFSRSSIYRG